MTRFPGAVYRADGRAVDRRTSELTVAKLAACKHRYVVRREPGAEITRVWLLNDDATVDDVPWDVWETTMGYVWNGAALLLVAHRPEPVVSLREMAAAVMATNAMMVRKAVGA